VVAVINLNGNEARRIGSQEWGHSQPGPHLRLSDGDVVVTRGQIKLVWPQANRERNFCGPSRLPKLNGPRIQPRDSSHCRL
jgi:hypothetical protein